MANIDFHYIKTGTGELSGPSFVEQTELAINEIGNFIEDVETTADSALEQAQAAQSSADAAQQTANSAVSQAQNAQASADAAQQAADQAQSTADEALEAAQNAGEEAGAKAPIMHASAETTYGVGSSTLYGHVRLSDSTSGTENAESGGTAATPYAVAQAMSAAQTAQSTADNALQVGQSAQQAANQAQASADEAQNEVNNSFSWNNTPAKMAIYFIGNFSESNVSCDVSITIPNYGSTWFVSGVAKIQPINKTITFNNIFSAGSVIYSERPSAGTTWPNWRWEQQNIMCIPIS